MRPTADKRSWRSQARWIGVCPEGDQVRRHTGWSMKPLSSKKTMGLPLSDAPFLSGANPVSAIALWPRRPLRAPVVRASGTSNPGRGAFARCNPGGTSRGIAGRRPRRSGDRSTNRFDSRPSVVRQEEFRQVGVSVSGLNGALVQDVVWPSRHPSLLSPQPFSTVLPKTAKRQGFRQPRRHLCRPGTIVLPAVGGLPIPLRFLSSSYHNLRIFTANGSLTI